MPDRGGTTVCVLRRSRTVLALCALGVAGGVGLPGCSSSPCTRTQLAVAPVTGFTDAPFALQATLTASRRPVVGASVSFYSSTTGGGPGTAGGGRVGSARTGPAGVAGLELSRVSALEPNPGERVTGYSAEFQPLNRIAGTLYCRSKSGRAVIRRV